MMELINNRNIIIAIVAICIIVYIMCSRGDISTLTDRWIKEVTVNHDPKATANLFCRDGNLVGTVSQIARMTFLYRNNCIFQLHSSVLPDLHKKLLKISEKTYKND